MLLIRALCALSLIVGVAACETELVVLEGDGAPPIDTGWNEELQGVYDCSESQDTGYRSGQSFQITVVHVDGEPVETNTANAYIAMQQAAAAQGVAIRIVSGFRTNAEQQYLYNCYRNCNCNNCNLAASPGYSNHQSGHALDLNTSAAGVLTWLNNNGARFGFSRTVPSEAWHWEWWGDTDDFAGPCGAPPPCPAIDVGAVVDDGVCVRRHGPSAYWRSEGVGHDSGLYWTNAFQSASPGNWAEVRLQLSTSQAVRLELFLDPRFAAFGSTRYKVRAADGVHTLTVDQGAIAPAGGGFVSIGDFTLNGDSALIVEDNVSFVPPDDRKKIMLDAVRVSAIPAPPPPPPPPADEPDVPDEPDAPSDGADDGDEGGLIPGDPVGEGEEEEEGGDDGDDVIGAQGGGNVYVDIDGDGGCSQGASASGALPIMASCQALASRRRRRRLAH